MMSSTNKKSLQITGTAAERFPSPRSKEWKGVLIDDVFETRFRSLGLASSYRQKRC